MSEAFTFPTVEGPGLRPFWQPVERALPKPIASSMLPSRAPGPFRVAAHDIAGQHPLQAPKTDISVIETR
jgi:hypothetical protein